MSSWSRRLESAQAKRPPRTVIEVPEEIAAVLHDDDVATVRTVAQLAHDSPGLRSQVPVRFTDGVEGVLEVVGFGEEVEFGFVDDDDDDDSDPAGLGDGADDEGVDRGDAGDGGGRITDMLTDTLVMTSDPVAVFSSVGAEAIWANDAFVTAIPIREADRTWLIDLLDEWSKGHFEVNVLPALVQHGRWHGKLVLQVGDDTSRAVPVVCSLVAHRDDAGEVEAVTMVARDVRDVQEADDRAIGAGKPVLAALVEDGSDLVMVVTVDGEVDYASPALTEVLGAEGEDLEGRVFLDLVHPDDHAKCDLSRAAEPDDDGVPPSQKLRLGTTEDQWRIIDVVATDLTENRAIGGFVLTGRDVTEREEAVARLADRAYTDPLTTLPNRMRLVDGLGAALHGARERSIVALLFDIDDFEPFCTEHGSEAGDEYLRLFGQRLADQTRSPDLVARLDGETFAVVVKNVADVDSALVTADRLKAALVEPYRVGSEDRELTLSVGVAVNHDGHTPESLLGDADSAVLIAKESGGDRIEVMTAEIRGSASRRRDMEGLLRRAISDGDGITVHYQPIIDLEDGTLHAAEALLRVHDDEGAMLSPASFLEAAEDTGLIEPLGGQVLATTCAQLASWNSDAEALVPRSISVNVSPRQYAAGNFIEMVREAITAADIEADQLWIELTESAMTVDREVAATTIDRLREMGVVIGLDDFGSGQSSLGALRRFSLDFVKIDRALVQGLGTDDSDTAIVRATVELAHSLGLRVCAVGVENEEQLDILRLLQVDLAQGFYFLPAVAADELSDKLQETYF